MASKTIKYTEFDESYYQGTEFYHTRLQNKAFYWYESATKREAVEGATWYWRAHQLAAELANEFDLTVQQSAAIISTLSPGTRWWQNVKDARAVIEAAAYGRELPATTTYSAQAEKAWTIANLCPNCDNLSNEAMADAVGAIDTAKKTISFYWNILDPTIPNVATIDRWMMRAMGIDRDAPTSKQYDAIAWAFVATAKELSITAAELQAIVWLAVKNHWDNR